LKCIVLHCVRLLLVLLLLLLGGPSGTSTSVTL
jgi:hypothetical protein